MTQHTLTSWNFYKGWDVYQNLLVKAIEPLTAEQLELKISPHLRSIGQLARHIVRTRAGWLHRMMGEGGPDIAAIAAWEYEGEVPSTAELVRGLEVTFRAWQECLERWTPVGHLARDRARPASRRRARLLAWRAQSRRARPLNINWAICDAKEPQATFPSYSGSSISDRPNSPDGWTTSSWE